MPSITSLLSPIGALKPESGARRMEILERRCTVMAAHAWAPDIHQFACQGLCRGASPPSNNAWILVLVLGLEGMRCSFPRSFVPQHRE